ncbi:MAG: SMC family ATPase, partial [Ruminococcus sp.]|nr:SMC family ATPase [Ruminococcus sp.]
LKNYDILKNQQTENDKLISQIQKLVEKGRELENNKILENKLSLQLEKENSSLENLRKAKETALSREPETEEYQKKIAEIKHILPLYDDARQKLSDYNGNLKLLNTAETDYKDTELKKDISEKMLADLETKLSELSESRAQKEKILGEIDKAETFEKQLNDILKSFNSLQKFRKDSENEQQEYIRTKNLYEQAKSAYDTAYEVFLDAQAGILAKRLKQGEKCPVCGSVSHPCPAQLSDEIPTQNTVDELKLKSDKANDLLLKKSSSAKSLNDRAENLESELSEKFKSVLNSSISHEELEKAFSEISEKKKDLKIKLAAAEQNIKNSEKIKADIQNLKIKIQDISESLGKKSKNLDAVKAHISEIKGSINTLTDSLSLDCSADSETFEFEIKNRQESLNRELYTAENSVKRIKEDISNAEKAFSQAEKNISRMKGELDNIRKNISDCPEIDMLSEQKKLDDALNRKTELLSKTENLFSRSNHNIRQRDEIKSLAEKTKNIEHRFQLLKSLSDTVSGNISGKERIPLEIYVQMTYFDNIIKRANNRLRIMTDGQYMLTRRTERRGGTAKDGLELDIYDFWGGAQRSVRSLSGGESFMASLALALALSEEIQSNAGGVHIDSMFIDEGFGSLDEKSLQQAVKSLSDLSEGEKLVGIISHVSELKNRIEHQISVTKDRQGNSSIKIKL